MKKAILQIDQKKSQFTKNQKLIFKLNSKIQQQK
jgi:hypothetical protein